MIEALKIGELVLATIGFLCLIVVCCAYFATNK